MSEKEVKNKKGNKNRNEDEFLEQLNRVIEEMIEEGILEEVDTESYILTEKGIEDALNLVKRINKRAENKINMRYT